MTERDNPLRHICIRLRERSERRGHPNIDKRQKTLFGSESRLSVLDPEIEKSKGHCLGIEYRCQDKMPGQTELLARAVADATTHFGYAERVVAPARLLAPIVRLSITPPSHYSFAVRLCTVMDKLLPSKERGISAR